MKSVSTPWSTSPKLSSLWARLRHYVWTLILTIILTTVISLVIDSVGVALKHCAEPSQLRGIPWVTLPFRIINIGDPATFVLSQDLVYQKSYDSLPELTLEMDFGEVVVLQRDGINRMFITWDKAGTSPHTKCIRAHSPKYDIVVNLEGIRNRCPTKITVFVPTHHKDMDLTIRQGVGTANVLIKDGQFGRLRMLAQSGTLTVVDAHLSNMDVRFRLSGHIKIVNTQVWNSVEVAMGMGEIVVDGGRFSVAEFGASTGTIIIKSTSASKSLGVVVEYGHVELVDVDTNSASGVLSVACASASLILTNVRAYQVILHTPQTLMTRSSRVGVLVNGEKTKILTMIVVGLYLVSFEMEAPHCGTGQDRGVLVDAILATGQHEIVLVNDCSGNVTLR
eukprot:GHVN01084573.1.p1 GENE.GHVN01084573.1~~GHVN01084573.1.p1  ORF type:complete len:393 (-),score=29.90 GHVN01084573.1:135-1313(-)